jgi:hypothetical protein
MRVIGGLALGVILGVLLFGPIKEYWGNLLNARVISVEARVENIEKFLNNAIEEGKKNAATPSAKTTTGRD